MIPETGKLREEWLYSLWPDRLAEHREQILECFLVECSNYRDGTDSEYYENLYQSALYLHLIGNVEDSVVLYHAKFSSFDLGCGLDYQFMLGAGYDQTLKHAKRLKRKDMVSYLKKLKSDPELSNIEEWKAFRIRYFKLKPNQGMDLTVAVGGKFKRFIAAGKV